MATHTFQEPEPVEEEAEAQHMRARIKLMDQMEHKTQVVGAGDQLDILALTNQEMADQA